MKSKNYPIETITIDSLSNSGDGVGRIDEKVVFVPYSSPGDTLRIEVIESKKRYSKGRILQVIEPSPLRTEPRCQVFGTCGGCDWQHIEYQQQLHWKKKNLEQVIQKIGGFQDNVWLQDVHPCSKPYHYRNRIQIHKDKTGFHYFQKSSRKPCYITECPLALPSINQWLEENSFSTTPWRGKVELAEMNENSVELFPVDDSRQTELGFRQVNDEQNDFLANIINTLVFKEQLKHITDLYCGQGNWALKIAKQHPQTQCLGIDINPHNIKRAQKDCLPNTRFLLGDVFELYPQWAQQTDLTIIDPPRAGCSDDTIELLCNHPSRWLIYISCHPATMARDLKKLCEKDWAIESLIPVDMFPQTSHLECMTILQSRKSVKTANP